MAFPSAPSKRPYERNPLEPNGRGKWQKTAPVSTTQQNHWKVAPGATVFRVLCHASKFGSIIGKGGGIVAKIRKETGAKIRIEETVQGCEERVVVITGSEKDVELSKERSKEDKEETGGEDKEETGGGDVREDPKENVENDGQNENPSALEDSKSEKPTSSAQRALLLVYERLVDGEPENDTGDEESKKSSPISVKLLILSSQVGGLLGKGGSVIKQMAAHTGALIRVLSKDKIPLCASPNDEIVQITGGIDSVRKALQSVSQQLLDNPPRERDLLPVTNLSGPSSQPFSSFPRPEGIPPANFHHPVQGPPFPNRPYDADYHSTIPPSFPNFHEGAGPGQIQVPPEQITYRLLCSSDKVGSLIGRGGSIIKNIQRNTGCDIKVHEMAPELDDCIVAISGPALPGDMISPAQDAVLRVQERIVTAVPDNKESTVFCRLLVYPNQTGCLLGKGGAVIAEMRKLSGAHIRVIGKDQTPKGVAENDELVQITGDFRVVQDALMQITTRLRQHLFRDKIPPFIHSMHPPVDQMPPFGPYMGRREPSPPRLYSNLPPFQNDSIGHPHEERSAFTHPIHSSDVPHGGERMPPAPWIPQGAREGGGPIPIPDYAGGAPQRRTGGIAGATNPAVITNTTVDVVVPRALLPSIYGEDGYCLRRIREISEAKIIITEPRPQATETVIIISGTPEQTHAAQSLLQAFVLSEHGGP